MKPYLLQRHPIDKHRSRVQSDSGQMQNLTFARAVAQWLRQSGEQDKTLLLALPGAGVKTRDSGLDKFITKLYSIQLPANDLTQTTEVNQPYLAGLIAPGDVVAAQNPSNGSRVLAHPDISFSAAQPWTITIVKNGYGNSVNRFFAGNQTANKTLVGIDTTGKLRYRNEDGTVLSSSTAGTYHKYLGTNAIIHIIGTGTEVNMYVNGLLFNSITIATNSLFNRINPLAGNYTAAAFAYYRIQSGAMSASQIASEAAMLRSYIPEIPAVQIGSQTWSIRNLDMVCTPAGNVIQEMQANSAVEKAVNGTFGTNVTGWNPFRCGLVWNAGGYCEATQNHTGSDSFGVTQASLTTGRFYKITFRAKSPTLTVKPNILPTHFSNIWLKTQPDLSTDWQTYEFYAKSLSTSLVLYLSNGAPGSRVDVDDISCQELGWINSTEIYDAVYAATSGDAATKNYAALKEAAMWRAYANSESNQVTYGKLYNGYAALLYDADMVNSGYGWRVPTAAEQSTLINALGGTSVAGPKLKYSGTNYWNTANGTNETGFSALGSGLIQGSTGAEGGLKLGIRIWSTTINNALFILDNATCGVTTYDIRNGFPIRLIKT